ncbi:HAMP domain-containing protein [Myxococcaceae bacterium GXIMD 01537]
MATQRTTRGTGKKSVRRDTRGRSAAPRRATGSADLVALREALETATSGDLTVRLSPDGKSTHWAEVAHAFNTMMSTHQRFKEELVRVEQVVGREGQMHERATVADMRGDWARGIQAVNSLIADLVQPTTEVARVIGSVARGDLTRKMALELDGQPVKGEFLRIGTTVNSMVDQLRSFAAEVTRVAREVGSDGKLGGQADVPGVAGTWKDLTDNVNLLANNLTAQVRNIAEVSTAVARGDLSRKISVDAQGEVLELKNTLNTMVEQLRSFAGEVTRVAKEVGTDGKLGGQAVVPDVSGTWKDLTDNVNFMASNLTAQVRNIALVTTAVANGDLSQKITVDVKGEILELKNTINTMVDQLRSFAAEVTRVAKEVGTEGKLGGQADVPGVAGVWKNLTDNVNLMARNLTTQVRGIVRVVTAVAHGELSQKLAVDAQGEVAALADTINGMTDTLATFAQQVSSVAREVGIEGKLGGQAKVPGARGEWRQLTDNVNQLAGNLTTQVRAISEVATAVTKGDLTRSISVDALGEVAALKDNVNQMIVNLKETTQKNTEQDWLKTNLAKFSGMMQGQKNLEAVSRLIMSELTPLVSAHHGAFFLMDVEGGAPVAKLTSSYAYRERRNVANRFALGEGLVGQCALEKKSILLTHVPTDYIRISSGLGEAEPLNIIVLPVLFEGEVKAIIELASFHAFSTIHQLFLDQLTESIGVVLNMIMANVRTEELLLQSQGLTQELQSQSRELTQQQEELKRSNSELEAQALELEDKAKLLEHQNRKVEEKNREVEQARSSLEEKAEQLSLISKYKSEFLANMSHELRTPLNSMLVLAKLLSDNSGGNLSSKQVEYAGTIYTSGGDLLSLINEILDLSKVEAGKMEVQPREVRPRELLDFAGRSFGPVAEQRGLSFHTELDADVPETIDTDPKRLTQILKNLLSNAFKFTSTGHVSLRIRVASPEEHFHNASLMDCGPVIAFSVIDTGIGIPEDKQRLIFEAFQQADGTTSRKYGGTGLGLSISRELARLLGGELRVRSARGAGSTFTLYLPSSLSLDCRGEPAEGEELETMEELMVAPLMVREPPAEPLVAPADGATAGERPSEESASLAGRRVLIVDDDVRNIFALTSVLESRGLHVSFANDGRAALQSLGEDTPVDAVLLDVMMPEMDGYEAMRAIRAEPRWADLPIIAVTALALPNDREKCLEAGATDYLPKPVDVDKLLGLLGRLL